MIWRLVQLEFLKLRGLRSLWVLLGLYVVAVVLISLSGGVILRSLSDMGVSYNGLDLTILPIYDFDDIWQNLTWLGYFFKIFPAFLLVISISNEFSYRTHRQNIIDGLSRTEFFLSKTSFALFLALLSGGLILILGLVLGGLYSDVSGVDVIFSHFMFVPGHILQVFLYFLWAIFLALLIRKSGITIVVILLYTIFEFIGYLILNEFYPLIADWLPFQSIYAIIQFPYFRYVFLETQTYMAFTDVYKALVWGGIALYGIYYQLIKRDF